MASCETSPRAEYARRLSAARAAVSGLERRYRTLGNLRLTVALVGVTIGWFAIGTRTLSPVWLVGPLAAFLVLAVLLEGALRRRERCARVATFYEQGMARIDDRWAGSGETGERFQTPSHPYAADLDLFGRGGLFELLSTARTRAGEECLARWLLNPATPEEVRSRQEAIGDLRGRLKMREELAVLGQDVRVAVHPEKLMAWAESPVLLRPGLLGWVARLLPVLFTASAVLLVVFGWRPPFLVLAALEGAFVIWLQPRVTRVLIETEHAAEELDVLAGVLARLERERFAAPRLKQLARAIERAGRRPSRQISRLRRIVELIESRDALPVRPIRPFTLWGTDAAFAAERWRIESGPLVRRWLDAVGEIEALSSLAGYAWEHPERPFAELVDDAAGTFEGVGLTHPLLAGARAVANDVRLDEGARLLLVSGSNMSGKSTLLRTVGINAALAMAGAPVCAARLRMSPLSIGASIRVSDSLQAGASRFYAEITRLRQILDLTGGGPPVLFLLDELLHGTNSHDRRIGAEAIILGLVERGALGLVTTHDLALSAIVESQDGRAANVHFEDYIEEGRMRFDYRLRPGVVSKSNAIELMRSIGLPL
jgi:hypothetical protein